MKKGIDKGIGKSNITLVDNDHILEDDLEIANSLNNFFHDSVKTLNINIPSELLIESNGGEGDEIDNILKRYSTHPSVLCIKNILKESTFLFSKVSINEIENELKNLDSKKSCKTGGIPTRLLKEYRSMFSKTITDLINNGIEKSYFDQDLKYADITMSGRFPAYNVTVP